MSKPPGSKNSDDNSSILVSDSERESISIEEGDFYQLTVSFLRAELSKTVSAFDSNLYISMNYSNHSYRTNTIKSSYFPNFHEKFLIPIRISNPEPLKISFFLEDKKKNHKKLDKQNFYSKDLKKIQNIWRWVNIYSNKFKTQYSGRVLAKFKLKNKSNPESKQTAFKPLEITLKIIKHTLWFEIIEVAGFGLNESLFINLQIGFENFNSNSAKCQNQRWVWGKTGKLKEILINLPEDLAQIPKLILKVNTESGKCIGSLIMDPVELIKNGSRPRNPTWLELNRESDEVDYLGFILMRVNLTPLGRLEYFRPETFTYKYNLYEIRAIIFQAQNIEISDISGLADPFLTVSFNGVSKKTSIQYQTLNPHWNEILTWKIDLSSENNLQNLVQINLWEWNKPPDNSHNKAKSCIPISKISQNSIQNPVWFHLKSFKNSHVPKVLVSFCMFSSSNPQKSIPSVFPKDLLKHVNCSLKVYIIGPRQLKNFNFLTGKILVRLDAGGSNKIETKGIEIKRSFKNFNFLEVLHAKVQIPAESLYAPSIAFSIVRRSVNNEDSILGVTCVDLAGYLPWNAQESSSEETEKSDRTRILDQDLNEQDPQEKNLSIKEKASETKVASWPGYVKRVKPRKKISSSFEKKFGSNLPFQTFELKKLEETSEVISSGFLRLQIHLFSENDIQSISDLSDDFLKISNLYVRFYIYSIKNLPKGEFPYFIWIKPSINSQEHKYEDQNLQGPDININSCYTLKLSLPNDSLISFELHSSGVSQAKPLFTYPIDIESRWFNKKFQEIRSKDSKSLPIETLIMQSLDNHDSKQSQNTQLIMCIELLTENELKLNPQEILNVQMQNWFEVRVVIWSLRGLSNVTKDLVIRACFRGEEDKTEETDTHYAAKTTAEFNWRLKFRRFIPSEMNVLVFEAWDLKEMKVCDEFCIDLNEFLDDLAASFEHGELGKEWIEGKAGAEILVQVYGLTQDEADEKPQGSGRDPPNFEPSLHVPKDGRSFDVENKEIIGLEESLAAKRKTYKKCIALMVCIAIVAAIPISLSVAL